MRSRKSLVMLGICFAAMVTGFLSSSGLKWPFYLSAVVLTLSPFAALLIVGRAVRIPRFAPVVMTAACGYVLAAAATNNYLSMAYLELIFLIGAFLLGVILRPRMQLLVAVTNVVFGVYLSLSILVYAGVIPLGRELALFEYGDLVVLGQPFTTFIGFYGSTASIDVYGLFVAAINFLYNPSVKQRALFAGLGLMSSVATLRYTPLAAFWLALLATWGWTIFRSGFARRAYVSLVVMLCFGSAIAVAYSVERWGYELLDAFTLYTSGRAPIWVEMLNAFRSDANEWAAVWLGTGSDGVYSVDLGFTHGNWIANPHNNYLSFLLKYGVVGWASLAVLSILVLGQMDSRGHFFISTLLLFSGISNLHTFGFYFPLYLLWLGCFYAMGARRTPRRVTVMEAVRASRSIAPLRAGLSRRKLGI